jgi:hypothetical protein
LWQNRWVVALIALVGIPGAFFGLFGVGLPLLSGVAPEFGWKLVAGLVKVGGGAALLTLIWAYALRWLHREERVGVRRAVSMGWLGVVLAAAAAWLGWWGLNNGSVVTVELVVLVLAGAVAVPLAWFANGGGDADGWACAACGYERPVQREGASEVCTECGNGWWSDAFAVSNGVRVSRLFRPARGAVRTAVGARARRARRRVVWCQGALGFVPTVFFLPWIVLPLSVGWLPTPAVVFVAERSGPTGVGWAAFREVWVDRAGVTEETRERLFRRVVERREAGWSPGWILESAFLDAASVHTFDEGLVDAYLAPVVGLRLEAVPRAGERFEVRLEGDLIGLPGMLAQALVVDVRAVSGSVVRRGGAGGKAGSVPVPIQSMARRTVFRDAFGEEPSDDTAVTDGSAWAAVVERDAAGAAAVEVEVEVWVELRAGGSSPASHQYFDSDGAFVEPSGVTWGERRVLRLSIGSG